MSSSSAQGWKKKCLTFVKGMSTLCPFCEANLTPFWCISRAPRVFLPTRFGLMTKFSNYSFFPLINSRGSTSTLSWTRVSCYSLAYDFFFNSLISLKTLLRWLFPYLSLPFFNVSSLMNMGLLSSIFGNCIVCPPGIWKFSLSDVYCPSVWVETFFIIEIWKGTKVFWFTGTKIDSCLLST
jgi:hypothetical protein